LLDDFGIELWGKVEEILTVEWLKFTKGLDFIVEIKVIITFSILKRPREPFFFADIEDFADSTPSSP
jgi:hypothetical protein